MKRFALLASLLTALGAAFVAGSWYGHKSSGSAGPSARKVLYYVDPMHPSYKSDKPGIAPDCGMQLEPVYEDGGAAGGGTPQPAGTVTVTPVQQQMLGVRVAAVSKSSVTRKVRLLGKVVADERRTYVINAPVDGWVQNTASNSTGSLVRKDEVLAHFYSPDLGALVRSLMFSLGTRERSLSPGEKFPARADLSLDTVTGLRNQRDAQSLDILRNLGLGERQIDELVEKRQWTGNVEITAPNDGFVIYRNVSEGVRLAKGAEMFRIANLEKVWIVADVYGDEAARFQPGMTVRGTVPQTDHAFAARVTDILPQFDAATRTMKLRLEADNPEYLLRPDMFVDLEVPVHLPAAVNVPADAVLDAGTRKTVFVDRGNGVFQPREVETGWQSGDRVEIVRGLSPGERIVVSGNFLVDSESRMKRAAAGIYGASHIDPVCGMEVDEGRAKAAGKTFAYKGKTYYLCGDECVEKVRREPSRFLGVPDGKPKLRMASAAPAGDPPGSRDEHLTAQEFRRGHRLVTAIVPKGNALAGEASVPIDPVCLMVVDPAQARQERRTAEHQHKAYFFCSDDCVEKFRKEPARYAARLEDARRRAAGPPAPTEGHAMHPVPAPPMTLPPGVGASVPPGPSPPDPAPFRVERLPADRGRGGTARPPVADGMQVEYVDPVCGKTVGAGRVTLYKGTTYYFCDDSCKRRFDRNPQAFLRAAGASAAAGGPEKNGGGSR